MEDEGAYGNAELALHVRVTTSDGVSTNHIYPLRGAESGQVESEIDLILRRILDAFAGITPILRLANPTVVYRADHVVRLAYDVRVEETAEVEDRGPIGFRPP